MRDRQGLTYGIYSYFQPGIQAGPFVVEMQTAPEHTSAAIAATITLLQDLRHRGVTPTELQTAQRSICRSYPVELANPDSLTHTLLMNQVYGLPLTEIQQFPQQVQAVTLADIYQAARDLLHPDQLVVVTAGPRNP
ncbi:M16 family metallopeptidase [Neosynechococcus sphagnicola]|uniref:M16 family metallopeptidase n=1 Tax=Neosynechococcus sphagnicola TaxID=1501145 RepID=UPI000AD8E6B8|nr:insulinase family protein [Neosynechococcus sphagnicola]